MEAYLRNSLDLSVIALLIMALSPMLSRRYTAKCRYYLWVVVFAALLFPVRPQINVALPEFLRPLLPSGTGVPVSGTVHLPAATNTRDWLQYAALLWGLGTICCLGRHAFQHLRFLSSVRRWSEDVEAAAVLELFTRMKGELGIQGNISLKSCACIKTPMLVGLLRPVLLLPQSGFHQDELPLILKHELIHHKRRDLWYKSLMLLALAIHWFNPVIYLVVKSALNLCEISCDEEVLKEIDAKGRARYGQAILGLIRKGGCQTVFSTNFHSGPKGTKQRIYAMMDMTRKRFSPVLFLMLLTITLCGTATFALSPAQAEDTADSELTDTEIQPPQGDSAPGTNEAAAAASESDDRNPSAGKAAPGKDMEAPEINTDFMLVSQEVKNVLRNDGFNSLIGLYCYDENGGVKMTRELLAAVKNGN